MKIFIVVDRPTGNEWYALGKYFQRVSNTLIAGRKLQHLTIIKHHPNATYAAVDVNMIKQKVNIVKLKNDKLIIACTYPNRVELLTQNFF